MRTKSVVLDSSALAGYLQRKAPCDAVKNLLAQARRRQVSVYMSSINLGKVLYITAQNQGVAPAERHLTWLPQVPITIMAVEKNDATAAALLKVSCHIPYADCFVVALAQRLKAEVMTSDRHFQKVEGMLGIRWV